MANFLRLISLLLALALPVSSTGHTTEQAALVERAEARFAAAGLAIPHVTYVFHPDTEACGWHRGLYDPNTREVLMCTLSDETILHELAHAWAEENLTDADQAGFLARRGLPTWDEHDHSWELRGTEHAAEILSWGLAVESKLVRWVEDGGIAYRLLTIPDSSPDRLIAEYRLLTGSEPVLRHPAEWTSEAAATFSPESA